MSPRALLVPSRNVSTSFLYSSTWAEMAARVAAWRSSMPFTRSTSACLSARAARAASAAAARLRAPLMRPARSSMSDRSGRRGMAPSTLRASRQSLGRVVLVAGYALHGGLHGLGEVADDRLVLGFGGLEHLADVVASLLAGLDVLLDVGGLALELALGLVELAVEDGGEHEEAQRRTLRDRDRDAHSDAGAGPTCHQSHSRHAGREAAALATTSLQPWLPAFLRRRRVAQNRSPNPTPPDRPWLPKATTSSRTDSARARSIPRVWRHGPTSGRASS